MRNLFAWAIALLPIVIFAEVLYLHALPPDLRPHVINLVGPVKVFEGDDPGFATPSFDDSGWRPGRLPAFNTENEEMVWVRKRFTLPDALRDRPLYFAAGGLWAGTQVFLNGHLIGRADEYVRGAKVEDFSIEGWPVPAGLVVPGPEANVLAMRMPKLLLQDSRLLLGEADRLQSYVLLNVSFKGFVLHGALGLLIFFSLLVAILYLHEEQAGERRRYRSALGVLLSAVAFVAMSSGVFPLREFSPTHILLLFLSMLAIALAFAEFYEIYFLKRASRIRFLLRPVVAILALVLVALYLGGREKAVFVFWERVCGPFLMIPLLWGLLSAIRGARREWGGLGPALAFAATLFVLGLTLDLLTSQQITSFPRVSPMATANLAIICSVMITNDFLKISYVNKQLSTSLAESNAGLAEALAKSQEAVRIKGEFVANVSHELRTPLNSIVNIPEGLVGLFEPCPMAECSSCKNRYVLEEGEQLGPGTPCPNCKSKKTLAPVAGWKLRGEPTEVVEHLQLLGRSAHHLLGLINDVLDFSKLEAGRMKMTFERFPLPPLLDEVCENLKALADRRGIALDVEVADALVELKADRVKVSQILTNLIGNAVKFSPDGATVKVCARRDGDQVEISVVDRGIGIPRESQELIFESFRQVDGSHTRKYGGTGLGLAITKQLVELHAGTISVESEPGQGSTFRVRLPIDGLAPPPTQQPAEDHRLRTILVVDDDPAAIEAVRLTLRPTGHRVVGISDPGLFIPTVEQVHPDLVILDVLMPRVSGLSLLHDLRAAAGTAELPVLVTSAYQASEPLASAHRALWLSKPWQGSELLRQVQTLLGERPRADSKRNRAASA